MSEHITHIAVYEDSVRMMKLIPEQLPSAFLESVNKSYDAGLFCSGSRGNHLFAVPILKTMRGRWQKDQSEKVTQQIAGAIGWITHRAADLIGKPVYARIADEGNPKFYNKGCRIYHDVVVMQKVYQGGVVSTESPYEYISPSTFEAELESTPGADKLPIRHVEGLFSHHWMKEFVGLASFTDAPEEADMLTYIDKLIGQSQELKEDLPLYIRSYQEPDPQAMQKYIYENNFYEEEDPIIRAVRSIQMNGEPDPSIDVNEALEQAQEQSLYAQSLRLSYDFLLAAAEFWREEIDEPTVIKKLRI